MEQPLKDIEIKSCDICCGYGFMKNCGLETEETTPYVICKVCKGTGKTEYILIFNKICCINK